MGYSRDEVSLALATVEGDADSQQEKVSWCSFVTAKLCFCKLHASQYCASLA